MFKLTMTFAVLLTSILGCSKSPSGHPPSVSAKQTAENGLAHQLAEASVKGHLLGVLAGAVDLSDDLELVPIATKADERSKRMRIETAPYDKVGFSDLSDALSRLDQEQKVRLTAERVAFRTALSNYNINLDPVITVGRYLKFFKNREAIDTLVNLGTPMLQTCKFLPFILLPVKSWVQCIQPPYADTKEPFLAVGKYGASLGQALFYKERTPEPSPNQEAFATYTRMTQLFDGVRKGLSEGRDLPRLSADQRKSFVDGWAEITGEPEVLIAKFKAFYDQFELSELQLLVAAELKNLKATIDVAPPKEDVPPVGTTQTATSMSAYEHKKLVPLEVNSSLLLIDISERQYFEAELKAPEVVEQLNAFARTLLLGLIEHWNEDTTCDVVFRRALDNVSEPKLKEILAVKLSKAFESIN